MGETNITINFDAAKLDALEFTLRKQRSSVQRRMAEMLQQLYESEVPEAVREYVDSKTCRKAQATGTGSKGSKWAGSGYAAGGITMAQHEEIIVWLDRRWKEAIEHHLKDETLQEHLENVLDELCNQLPEREYKRISREIWEEDRMAREEAARTYSAYRVVEGGEEHYFRMTPGEELLDAARTLRRYCTSTEHSTGKFISLYSQAQPITPEEYQWMILLRMEKSPACLI